jgi:hypothetical protein
VNLFVVILGSFFVLFGLVVRTSAVVRIRKDPNYHPTTVWTIPVSLGAVFILDGFFI